MGDDRRNTFLRGALVLTVAGLASKVLGSLYRIPLTWLIGPEGMGLFQLAYPLYLIFLALSTAGLPVAVARLIAQRVAVGDRGGVRAVLKTAAGLLVALGLAGSLIMLAGARAIASRLYDPRAFYTIAAFAPAVFMMAVLSAWRGYFQGWQQMTPVAASQILEQVVRVGTMLVLAVLLVGRGVEHAAAGVAFGGFAGAVAAWAYLILRYFAVRKKLERRLLNTGRPVDYRHILNHLVRLAWPIALGAVLVPLIQAVDSALVPARLSIVGFSPAHATAAMGDLGNAWALVVFPTVITAALSTSLVPAVSEAQARGDMAALRARVKESFRMAFLIGVPAAAGLWVMSPQIARLLFSSAGAGAGVPLRWLAPAALFLGLQQTTAGALQGLGRPGIPVRNFAAGAVVKIALTYWLAALPGLGLRGAAIGTVICSALTSSMNLVSLVRMTRTRLPVIKGVVIPFVGGAVVAAGAAGVQSLCSRTIVPLPLSVLAGIAVSALLYFTLILRTGAVEKGELTALTGAFQGRTRGRLRSGAGTKRLNRA